MAGNGLATEKFVIIGASHGGFLTLEYTLAYPEHLYGALMGDCGAQLSHWGAMSAMKTALTDRRVKPDPEQLLRALTGNLQSMDDQASWLASIFPLYTVPDHLRDQAETDINLALDGAIIPVSDPFRTLP
jgi:proline iminopeptidase